MSDSRDGRSASCLTCSDENTLPSTRPPTTSSFSLVALVDALLRNKPSASKGQYLRTFFLTATQGPSVPVDVKEAARLQLAG